jgi:hypothetical protein
MTMNLVYPDLDPGVLSMNLVYLTDLDPGDHLSGMPRLDPGD